MTSKENKFGRETKSVKKKGTWFEANQCGFERKSKCYMLGEARTHGDKWYCSYHFDILQGGERDKIGEAHFKEWYKQHMEHLTFPNQFSGYYPDDEYHQSQSVNTNVKPPYSKEQENKTWNRVNCNR